MVVSLASIQVSWTSDLFCYDEIEVGYIPASSGNRNIRELANDEGVRSIANKRP